MSADAEIVEVHQGRNEGETNHGRRERDDGRSDAKGRDDHGIFSAAKDDVLGEVHGDLRIGVRDVKPDCGGGAKCIREQPAEPDRRVNSAGAGAGAEDHGDNRTNVSDERIRGEPSDGEGERFAGSGAVAGAAFGLGNIAGGLSIWAQAIVAVLLVVLPWFFSGSKTEKSVVVDGVPNEWDEYSLPEFK